MIVYNQVNANGKGHIFAARYDGLAISPLVRLATGAHVDAGPHIAYRPGGDYLVVWENAEGHVSGRFVSPAVEPGLAVTITAETEEVPVVAHAGSSFLVAWRALVPGGVQIRAALVSSTGEVSAPVDVSSLMAVADRPSVSCDATCTVLWTGGADPTATQLWRRQLGGDLTPLGDEAIAVGGPSVQGPGELAGTGSARYLVWLDGQSGMVDAYGSTASIDSGGGLALGGPTFLQHGVLHQDLPAVAVSSTQWLVGWEDSRNGGVDLFGRRFGFEGVPKGAGARAIHERAWIQGGVAIAGNESGFLAAWKHDEPWPAREVRATRIGPGGAPLDPAGITLGPAGVVSNEIRIASAGAGGWLVAWGRRAGSAPTRVHAAIVRPDGSTTDLPEFDGHHPMVDFDPGAGVYLLLWFSQDETGTWGVRGVRIAPDGTLIDAVPVTVASDIFYIGNMAFGAGRFLVVFEGVDDRVFGYRVRIGSAGIELLDPAPFPLDPAPGRQERPVVTSTAKGFLVAYESLETGVGDYDIHGVQVSPDGNVQGSAFVLADGPDDDRSPAFAGASQGRALLAFRRFSDDWPGQRYVYTVVVRRLVIGFPDGATCTDDAQCESGSCMVGFCCGPASCP